MQKIGADMDGKALAYSSKKQKHKHSHHDSVDMISALACSSNNQKHNDHDSVDMISSVLPDSILGVILSILPTKNAVATAVLSKRWNYVWTTVHNLDFYHHSTKEKNNINDMKFVEFVDRCLLLGDGGLLYKFCLVWDSCRIPSNVTPWITTAITRNVHELCVRLYRVITRPFEIPISAFRSVSLRSLELEGLTLDSEATLMCCLPRLETLKLFSMHFHSEETFEKLISGCPMLDHLHLDVCSCSQGEHVFTYIISSTSLRRLELVPIPIHVCSIKLEVSSLEYLKVCRYMPKFSVQTSLSSLVEVDIGSFLRNDQIFDLIIYSSIVELVRAFDCTKSLTLSGKVMRALSHALSFGKINLSTVFKRLVKLDTRIYHRDYRSLIDLLQSSHNLQVLMICQSSSYLGYSQFREHLKWTTPPEVPRCFSNSLRKVEFDGYCGDEDEREMIRYMLKHGSALEVMEITRSKYGDTKGSIFSLVQEIHEYPIKSPFCEVKFYGWTSNKEFKVPITPAHDINSISKRFFLSKHEI